MLLTEHECSWATVDRIPQDYIKTFEAIEMNREVQECNWASLIERARFGCDEALGEILKSVRSYLVVVANANLGGRVQAKFDASDVVQYSMIEASKSIDQFRGSSEHEFRSWIKRIVLNNLADEAKRYTDTESRNVNIEVSEDYLKSSSSHIDSDTPSWHLQRKEFDFRLAEAVAQLPDRQRFVIEARHRRCLDYQEIADQLEISETAARKIWSRASQQLRVLLDLPQ